ncbi:hypothetical protein MUP01_04720 [Candidatus Bathyarchaeota archaeon]|nr:hypothetical protein [Candidatus Bathyarchaeota archaeon]
MTNKYYDHFKAVFDRVKADLEAVTAIKAVSLGEQFRLTSTPFAIINAEDAVMEPVVIGTMLKETVSFSVVLVIRETEPTDWFTEIVSVMGDVVDKILADQTLNGTVKDCYPVFFSPGEIRMQNKLYYGGVVRFSAWGFYTP